MNTFPLYLMMNPVREIFTNKLVGFEKILKAGLFETFSPWNAQLYLQTNEKVEKIGTISPTNDDYKIIQNILWRQYTIALNENTNEEEIQAYLNTNEGVFQNCLMGILYTENGWDAGYKWDGIVLVDWQKVESINRELQKENYESATNSNS